MGDVYRLSAVLRGCNRGDNLRDYGAGNLEGLGALNHLAVHYGAVVEHILYVDEAAVEYGLEEVVRVVEVDCALVVCLGDVFGEQNSPRKVLGNFARNEVALSGRGVRVLVGVFLHDVLIGVLYEREYALVSGVCLSDECALIAVEDVCLHELELLQFHQLFLDHVLDVLYKQSGSVTGSNVVDDRSNLFVGGSVLEVYCLIGLVDGVIDLASVEVYGLSVSFNNFHLSYPPLGCVCL